LVLLVPLQNLLSLLEAVGRPAGVTLLDVLGVKDEAAFLEPRGIPECSYFLEASTESFRFDYVFGEVAKKKLAFNSEKFEI
jgi:hypothetical protein